MIPQSLQINSFCAQKLIICQIELLFPRRRFFDDIVHYIDDENVVTYVYFDCGNNFPQRKLVQKLNRPTENGKTFPDPVKHPSASQVTINITVLF